jgi:hypothetical protein
VDLRTAPNEKCGECQPGVRTETEIGMSQREIGRRPASLSRIVALRCFGWVIEPNLAM